MRLFSLSRWRKSSLVRLIAQSPAGEGRGEGKHEIQNSNIERRTLNIQPQSEMQLLRRSMFDVRC
jgi:hypothetical protein